jgi:Uma2 family endonuclease
MPRLPETAWLELAPDWLCDILSPATASKDRVEKLPIYAAFGVSRVWLIDPDQQTLEVFENREGALVDVGRALRGKIGCRWRLSMQSVSS